MNTTRVGEEKIKLRTGFTTGSSATAASKSALLSIINQQKTENVSIRLPKGSFIDIPIHSCEFESNKAKCSVIKDGGDDPDVTHGAEIIVELSLTEKVNEIDIDGGEGVGIVTKPGLGLEINKPAINPVPKKMIIENLREVGEKVLVKNGIRVVISVPKGRELGPKTDNPRLGIKNGISILGTSGIVIPFSTASYAASIRQNLDVAIAMGNDTVVLTTGGRSEDFAKKIVDLPEQTQRTARRLIPSSGRLCSMVKTLAPRIVLRLAPFSPAPHSHSKQDNLVDFATLSLVFNGSSTNSPPNCP